MSRKLIRGIRKASKPVKATDKRRAIGNEPTTKQTVRNRPVQGAKKVEELPESEDYGSLGSPAREAKEFETIEVESSKGKRYKIAVPKSYVRAVPRKWEWTTERYRVAELIAMGVPITQIPDDPGVRIKSRMAIYCWLQHPEFKEHVDGITMETGWANKRERISGLNRLTRLLFDKVVSELDGVQITDKSIGAILTSIQTTAKLIAQEKEEFVEEAKITQDTNVTGTITNVEAKLDELMASKTEEERKKLEKEFDEVGDDIIRSLTGDKSVEDNSED